MYNLLGNTDVLATWPPLRIYSFSERTHWLPVATLLYLEGELGYTWLHTEKSPALLQTYTLRYFAAQLPASSFIRIHRRYLVNQRFIQRLERKPEGAWVRLTTGICLPVSRRQYTQLYQRLNIIPSASHTKPAPVEEVSSTGFC